MSIAGPSLTAETFIFEQNVELINMSQRNSFHGDLPKLQPLPVILPGQVREMNKEEKLKARLYSYAPLTAPINPRALKFKGVTQCQARKLAKPIERRVEPLPSLQKYQETHQPEFLQKKELERLEKLRKLKEEAEKAQKRLKKRQSISTDVDSLQDLTVLKKSRVKKDLKKSSLTTRLFTCYIQEVIVLQATKTLESMLGYSSFLMTFSLNDSTAYRFKTMLGYSSFLMTFSLNDSTAYRFKTMLGYSSFLMTFSLTDSTAYRFKTMLVYSSFLMTDLKLD
ncbi:hypothetical protein Btru_056541 [Bulinus truncatus]|nr:hypothetical protein Btru_056541 [Bulinus truncatus]